VPTWQGGSAWSGFARANLEGAIFDKTSFDEITLSGRLHSKQDILKQGNNGSHGQERKKANRRMSDQEVFLLLYRRQE